MGSINPWVVLSCVGLGRDFWILGDFGWFMGLNWEKFKKKITLIELIEATNVGLLDTVGQGVGKSSNARVCDIVCLNLYMYFL